MPPNPSTKGNARASARSPSLRALLTTLIGEVRELRALVQSSQKNRAEASASPRKRRIRQPSDLAITAYRAWLATQKPQKEIASLLSQKTGEPITQVKVSRFIKRVKTFLEAGSVLPDIPEKARREKAIDPSKIELGRRVNPLTLNQRPRANEED